MEMVVVIKEEKSIPANWKTAEECHELAVSWKNEEIQKCVDFIMAEIIATAKKGGICKSVEVAGGRPEYFYTVLKDLMKSLGYAVEVPLYPYSGKSSTWKFTW